MNIGIIEPVGGHGGMDYYDYGLAQGLGNNSVNVYYFTSTKTIIKNYKNVTTKLIFKNVWETNNKFSRLYFFLNGYLKSFKKSKKLNISIVHLQFFDLGLVNFLVVLLMSFFNYKKVLTLHDVSSFRNDNISYLEKWILNKFNHIIVHNKLSKKELLTKGVDGNKISIIPHGNYLPFVNQLDYESVGDTLKLLFFGQIKKVKGLEVLLKSLSLVYKKSKKIHLTIAGRPWHDDKKKYFDLIEELDIKDIVSTNFNYIDDEDVESYFKECDVVVLPYKKIYQSGVLLLSMSYGRVVLTSNLPAFKEIIEHDKTGLLFELNDEKSLAEIILEINNNKGKLKKINNLASDLLKEKFNWRKIGGQTKELYEKVNR